ncbi:MAG TPA: hypothetical protein VJ672_15240 [Gemmatimonadaceae bacterium]|nr:hypothetical protein [Gemmatimonadaceae bacterium]
MSDVTGRSSNEAAEPKSDEQKVSERREFLKRGAMALGAGALTLGGVRDLFAAAQRIAPRAYITTPAATSIDPFRIAIMGDSVMWGQGLREENKIHSKLISQLNVRLNARPIEKQFSAHSGAIIGIKELVSNSADWAARNVNGEVPSKYPTIAWQAQNQIANPELVDLVVMDGGINDVTVGRIITMDYTQSLDGLRLWTRDACGGQMEQLLADIVLPRFPKATVVVTNYFPIVTHESDPLQVQSLVAMYFSLLTLVLTLEARRKVADQAIAFHTESTMALRSAVGRANQRHNTQRVLFVESGFGSANAIGGTYPYLYKPGELDEVTAARAAECDKVTTDPLCKLAAMGHPNAAGASMYATRILGAITPLLAGWAAPSTAPVLKTMVVSAVAGTSTTTARTITVHAKDGASGAPLNGTVRINGATGVTGQPITFTACSTTETFEGPLGKPVTRTVRVPCPGSVSVSGYADGEFSA